MTGFLERVTRAPRSAAWCTVVLMASAGLAGCQAATLPSEAPTFEQVSPILDRACAECHSGDVPAAGWSVSRYVDVIACADGRQDPPTAPGDETSMLLTVLDQEDHAGLLTAAERATLASWLAAGVPSLPPAMHPSGWSNPRSPDFHGAQLRAEHWERALNPDLADSCGRCHDGSPTRPAEVTAAAVGAPACTDCHDQPDGVLDCSTCHGDRGHAYPPRDVCFFGDASGDPGVHAKHVDGLGLDCATCHAEEHTTDFRGIHGDGRVQVVFTGPQATEFSPRASAAEASYDESTQTCTVACHDRGGDVPTPRWSADERLDCNSCHTAPPEGHYAGQCSSCHAEVNTDGTARIDGPLHGNGRVDLGNGSGDCTACHGVDPAGWPADGAHPFHREPELRVEVPCASCHIVPADPMDPGHFDDTPGAEVVFSGLATARGAAPTFDGERCANVACHGEGLDGGALKQPAWADTTGAPSACGACHSIPPAAPHPDSNRCASAVCHGDEIVPTDPPMISPPGRLLHINGTIEHGRRTP